MKLLGLVEARQPDDEIILEDAPLPPDFGVDIGLDSLGGIAVSGSAVKSAVKLVAWLTWWDGREYVRISRLPADISIVARLGNGETYHLDHGRLTATQEVHT